ncbi:bacterial transcriptional activator domain-containing protein [Streptomyces sp. HUAS MG91]|uniref:Bacterial transcriptional activator domain-containing protein n=1 Tax=Streptomyces tabacisoli TaxID=3156398 RepID=A0AAU8J167_9ACTN
MEPVVPASSRQRRPDRHPTVMRAAQGSSDRCGRTFPPSIAMPDSFPPLALPFSIRTLVPHGEVDAGCIQPRSLGGSVLQVSVLPSLHVRTTTGEVLLGPAQQQLIAYLATRAQPSPREQAATDLFPRVPLRRASARLRQLIWRTQQTAPLLAQARSSIAIAKNVNIDFREALTVIQRIERGDTLHGGWELLSRPLLKDLDTPWAEELRHSWDLRRLAALEQLAVQHMRSGELRPAILLADRASEVNPLREAPRRIAVTCCVRAGEPAEAHVRVRDFEALLRRELGIGPSRQLVQALASPGTPVGQGIRAA